MNIVKKVIVGKYPLKDDDGNIVNSFLMSDLFDNINDAESEYYNNKNYYDNSCLNAEQSAIYCIVYDDEEYENEPYYIVCNYENSIQIKQYNNISNLDVVISNKGFKSLEEATYELQNNYKYYFEKCSGENYGIICVIYEDSEDSSSSSAYSSNSKESSSEESSSIQSSSSIESSSEESSSISVSSENPPIGSSSSELSLDSSFSISISGGDPSGHPGDDSSSSNSSSSNIPLIIGKYYIVCKKLYNDSDCTDARTDGRGVLVSLYNGNNIGVCDGSIKYIPLSGPFDTASDAASYWGKNSMELFQKCSEA